VALVVLLPVALGLLAFGARAAGRDAAVAPAAVAGFAVALCLGLVEQPVMAILLSVGALSGGVVLARRLVSTSPPPDDDGRGPLPPLPALRG